MRERGPREVIMPFSVRHNIPIQIPHQETKSPNNYQVDFIVFDQFPGMELYKTVESFQTPGRRGSEGIDVVRDEIKDVLGNNPDIHHEFDMVTPHGKIGLISGHGGEYKDRWALVDNPIDPKVMMEPEGFIFLLPWERYDALVLAACNPGRYNIKLSPVPVFYVHGSTPDYRNSARSMVYKPY